MSSNQAEEPGFDVVCAAVVQSEQIIRKYYKHTNLFNLRLPARYTSKEGADDEEFKSLRVYFSSYKRYTNHLNWGDLLR